jgi:hypothetical protein
MGNYVCNFVLFHFATISPENKKSTEVFRTDKNRIPIPPIKPTTNANIRVRQNAPISDGERNKPKIDYSGIKVGSVLTHNIFGQGKVVGISSDIMIVSFGKALKKFQFPQAIQNGFFKIG